MIPQGSRIAPSGPSPPHRLSAMSTTGTGASPRPFGRLRRRPPGPPHDRGAPPPRRGGRGHRPDRRHRGVAGLARRPPRRRRPPAHEGPARRRHQARPRHRPHRRRRPRQPQHRARRRRDQSADPGRDPPLRPGARRPHPGAVQRRRRALVVGAGGARLRVSRNRRRIGQPIPVGRPARREPAFERAVPWRDIDPDRATRRGPDGRDAPRRRCDRAGPDPHRRRGTRRTRTSAIEEMAAAPAGGPVKRLRSGLARPDGVAGATARQVRGDPARPGDRLGDLLPARGRPEPARRRLVRDHVADRGVVADQHRLRERQRRPPDLRDLPQPRRRGHRGRRLCVHHGRADPLATPADARPADRTGQHPRPRDRRRARLDRLSRGARARRARRAGRGGRGQRRRPLRVAGPRGRASPCTPATRGTRRCSRSSTSTRLARSSRRPATT